MKEYEIKTAEATYTGGNIYLYHGELTSGLYFVTNDDGITAILDVPADCIEDSIEWQRQHIVETLLNENRRIAFVDMLCDHLLKVSGGCLTNDEIEENREWMKAPI